MLALARPSVNEVWPLAANQNHRYNRPANDNNITSGLCTRTKYGYDGLGRRIVNKVDNQGSITQLTRVWCGERPCQLRNNTLSLRRYLLDGEYDNVSGERSLYLTDNRSSVRDFVSVLNGARIGAIDYSAYGQQRQVNGTQPHFQYAGLLWDGQAGLSFSFTRPYEAGIARWLTRDWIREQGGINMYAYAGGNPAMRVDPNGEFFVNVLVGGVSSAAMGYIISELTGECYTFKDALIDLSVGSAGVGVISKLNKLYRVAKLRWLADTRYLNNAGRKGYTETWGGGLFNDIERLKIKFNAGTSPNLQAGSRVPRFEYRIDHGKFWDPFTNTVGPKGALSHVPLEPTMPLTSVASGAAIGGVTRAVCGCSR